MDLNKQNSAPVIFLCYAREDIERVYSFYALLKGVGLRPWMDKYDILPGENWQSKIKQTVRKADFFIAFFSKQSIGKPGYVQKEYKLALDTFAERPPGSIFLIPVRLDDCEIPNLDLEGLGIELSGIQRVDLPQKDSITENDIEPILKAIETQSTWRRPSNEFLTIVREYDHRIDESIIETMRVRELPYVDEILELKAGTNEKQLPKEEEKAFNLYLSSPHKNIQLLGLKNYYLIASYLYQAIIRNDFTVCKHKPFIYPIHQYLSKTIRTAEEKEKKQIIATLIKWLTSKEAVYETSRDFAVFELGMSKANEAAEVLLDALEDINELPLVRYYGAMALGMIKNNKTIDRLVQIYSNEKYDKIKEVVAHAIIYITKF